MFFNKSPTIGAGSILGPGLLETPQRLSPRDFLKVQSMGPFNCSQLWAPVLKVVYNGVIMAL